MADNQRFDLGNYVDVSERIAAFKAEYPDGSLQADIYLLTACLWGPALVDMILGRDW